MEIGTAAANAGVFHDGGLEANTQYQYRIRSFNGLGNSGYSSTVSVTTLDHANSLPPVLELNSFALYSSKKTELRSQALFTGGGAVGSDTLVELQAGATVDGNVVSGGDIILRSGATLNGNATAADSITVETGANINGDAEQGATVAFIDIPVIATIPIGTSDVSVDCDGSAVITPGYYKKLTVNDRGKVTLTAGTYTFTELFLATNATIELDIAMNEMVEIQVGGEFEMSDYSRVVFKAEGYVPFIRLYTNDASTVRIGCGAELNGTLTAPHAEVHMYSRAQCRGALYAKTIVVEPEAVILSGDIANQCEDSDGDKIANIIEVLTNTDPADPNDYIPMAIPSISCIDNTQAVTITYDFSVYFPEYSFATAMTATFPAGSLTKSFIPLLITVRNEPTGVPAFSTAGYEVLGRYIDFLPENGLVANAQFTLQTPHLPYMSATDYKPFQYGDSTWDSISQENITGSDDYSETVIYHQTNPIIFAGQKKTESSRTLYFDGGYVYSNTANSIMRFDIGIEKWDVPLGSVKIRIEYTDYATGTAVDKVYEEYCDALTGLFRVNVVFDKKNPLISKGEMRIRKAQLIYNFVGDSTKTSTYTCTASFVVSPGQVLIMKSQGIAMEDDAAGELISLYYYPCTETFESASFGDGRILYNADGGSPYSYEYFLTDHLGSTRMVLDDQANVTEMVNYMPYGMMSEVPGATTASIPVRDKFTGKEYDEEGEDSGVGGIKAYYFGARYYDPELGIWLSRDPQEQFWNPYAYTTSPVMYTDPNGEIFPYAAFFWTMAGVGALTGGAIAAANGGDWSDIFMGAGIGFVAGGMIGGIPLMLPEGLLAGASAAATASAPATFAAQAANVGYQAYNMSRVSKLSQQSWLQVAGDGVVDATGKPAWASSSKMNPIQWGQYAREQGQTYGWPYAHVLASAGITRDWGVGVAWTSATLKEFLDVAKGVFIDESRYSAWQPIDLKMNRIGRRIPKGISPEDWAAPYKNYPEGEPGPMWLLWDLFK